ncbi:MAG: glycosyltransferase [Bdellovibrionales bacterium]|nr:glycosyltransferase [Bdellovibrionales bacterium]
MLVSVVIPVRNRPELLLRAIRSVINQQDVKFELIVVDDGSDISLGEAEELVTSENQQWVRQEAKGVASARNKGIRLARGDWIAFLDSDDYWLPPKLARQMKFHAEHPEFRISQTEEIWIRHGRRVNKRLIHAMPQGEAFHQSIQRCCISPSSVMIHRDIFSNCGEFDEELMVCEDYELWLRITSRYQVGYISDSLVVKTGGHKDQLSKSVPAMDRFRVYSLLKLLGSSELSESQEQSVRQEVTRKVQILKEGAKKHMPDAIPIYDSALDYVQTPESCRTQGDIASICHLFLM